MEDAIFQTLYNGQKRLYQIYDNEVRDNIEKVEKYSGKRSVPIFNELRAFQDHMARCFVALSDAVPPTPDDLKKQMDKAEGHLIRCRLDCYKSLWIHQGRYVESLYLWPLRLSKFTGSWGDRFLNDYVRLKLEAKEKNMQAREFESSNKNLSFDLYKQSLECLTKLEELFRAKKWRIRLSMWARGGIQLLIIVGIISKGVKTIVANWDSICHFMIQIIKNIQ